MKKKLFGSISLPATLLIIWSLMAGACSQSDANHEAPATQENSANLISYAQGFSLEDKDSHYLLSIKNPFSSRNDAAEYALVKKGNTPPPGFPSDRVIEIPVSRIAVTSNPHIGAIDLLHAAEFLVAVGDTSQIYSETVRQRISRHGIAEIHKGAVLNGEKVVELQPDVLIVTGSPEAGIGRYVSIGKAGIPVIINSEWMETSPLGRAEWIKLMAVLLDRLNHAEHLFAMVENTYQAFAARAESIKDRRPGVLLGNEFQGVWHMPGGKSFMANLLKDSGADYHWGNNDQTGSIPLSFEAVYPVALEADAWLNIYTSSPTAGKKELIEMDARYKEFKAVKNGQLYSFVNRVAPNGANDYWESSVYRPDLLLGDFLHILHPDLLPDYSLYFCKKLE